MNNFFRYPLLASLICSGTVGSGTVKPMPVIEHLGANHTLVRIPDDGGKYLLLPVQESNDDALIDVILDGRPVGTIYARLAKTRVDFFVPFDISKYGEGNLLLSIVADQSRSSVREIKDDVCWHNMVISDTFDTSNREKYRPAFHHTPLYGWMNDPNGMFYRDGVWHLYYQWNPYGSKWQNMTWGHSTSRDLVNWEHHQAAIEPNALGTIFSGSSAIDSTGSAGFGKNAVVALYTSAGKSQMQSLAWSNDNGYTFNVYPGNPVITLETEARDPNMFWDAENNCWILILAHPLEHEMLIFSSPDMKQWTLIDQFGKGIGAQNGVWECPDFFELTVPETGEKKWVILCNINPGGPFGGSATQYFIGDFDGRKFTVDTEADGSVLNRWLDYGKDHYATVSWSDAPDGRHTVIGWMSNWQYAGEVPTTQYRSANTLPRDMELFRAPDGRLYVASVPSPELLALRGKLFRQVNKVSVGSKAVSYALPVDNDGISEILLDIDADKARSVTLTLSNGTDHVDITYDPVAHTMSFDRRESGIVDFSEEFPAVTVAPTYEVTGKTSLRLYIDRSSIELFGDNGRYVMTNLVFPTQPYTTLSISSKGGRANMANLKIYSINN